MEEAMLSASSWQRYEEEEEEEVEVCWDEEYEVEGEYKEDESVK